MASSSAAMSFEPDDGDATWDEFYGSSSTCDLVPTLMDIFDAMINGNTNGAQLLDVPHEQYVAINRDQQNNRHSDLDAAMTCQQATPSTPILQPRHFPVLKIVEPGDRDPAKSSMSSNSGMGACKSTNRGGSANSPRRSVSFRSTETPATVAPNSNAATSSSSSLVSLTAPMHGPLTGASSCSSSSSSSSSSAFSTTGSSPITRLTSVDSLEEENDDPSANESAGAPPDCGRPLANRRRNGIQNGNSPATGELLHRLRRSGDSGDSGVSSPDPPCSEASDKKRSSSAEDGSSDHVSYMDRVVMEVVESEAVYVRDLHQVVQGYLYYWRDQGDRAPVTAEQAAALFGNVEEIYRFNSQFLTQLQSCGLDPVEVARSFVRNNSGFTIYTDYCTNYPRKVSVLTDLMRNESASRACRERQTELQHTLPLGSYLLKPVQRILKYHLLLQNIVKHCDRSQTPGYSDIIVALSAMTGIAHHINDMKRKHEHAVRVQEVQSLLDGWPGEDLTTYGELVAEGSFRVYGAKAPRHVFLLDRMLLIVKRREDGTLGYKAHIMCSNLMLIESVPGEPLSFHVIPFDNPRQQYTLEARNLEQKREWTLQLKRVILENYDAVIPHHARQLVLQLGQERCSQERQANSSNGEREGQVHGSGSSSATKRHQHSAPEYLERRKHSNASLHKHRMRKVRKNCDASSPRESPLLPRRLRRSFESRDRSVSRDRSEHEIVERKFSTQSCPGTELASAKPKVRRFGAWRRRSEPSNEPIISHPCPSESTASVNKINDYHSEANGTLEVETVSLNEQDPSEMPQQHQQQHQRVVPESIERIVEQLVLQNVEIQRILQKKKRRDSSRRPFFRAESTPDEGIYESLTMQTPSDSIENSLSDADGDYISLRTEEGSHFSRCHLRRSLGVKKAEPMVDTCRPVPANPCQTRNAQAQVRPTLSRSLSCPARGQQAMRIIKKTEEDANDCPSGVSARIQKLLNQIGSPDQWSSLLRNFTSPQRNAAETSSNYSRCNSKERRDPIELDGDAAASPCIPAVWLQMQSEHLAEPGKKSGSLPRSFQTPPEIKSRWMDRPVTIASDRPAPIDLQTDHLELYLRSQQDPSAETAGLDDSLTDIPNTPRVSTDNIHVHPEYKIYRRSASKSSLRTVLSSVSSKLRSGSEHFWGSLFSLSQEDQNGSSNRHKLVHYLARRYADLLRQRQTLNPPSTPVAVHSAAVGARMAHANDTSDYTLIKHCPQTTPSCYSTSRSDLSSSKSTASLASKTTWYGTLESTRDAAMQMMMMDSDDSASDRDEDEDSAAIDPLFYEKAFEAVEQLLDSAADWCRDSAIFSDRDDAGSVSDASTVVKNKPPPPPVPAKSHRAVLVHQQRTRGLAILERMRSLEENGKRAGRDSGCSASLENLKSIGQRRLELTQAASVNVKPGDESETSSQHSTSTINTVVEVHPAGRSEDSLDSHSPIQRRPFSRPVRQPPIDSVTVNPPVPAPNPLPKGWVKHIIGKLQGDPK